MSAELTDRQKEILGFIQEFISSNGFPPTFREIASHFNLASTFGVKRHIDALVKKGFLNSISNSGRTLSVVNLSPAKEAETCEIPIIGRVAAGYPILAEENIEGTLSLDPSLIRKKKDCFGLKVKGDSMINAGIFEGDLVIISPQKECTDGDIVVALLDDEATMKRFVREDGQIYLKPENENYSIIDLNKYSNFSIIGKVIGVFRSYN
jgi:repressor LexA